VRLQARGLVDERDGTWYIVDPLFSEWLRRSSPLAAHRRPRRPATYRLAGTVRDRVGGPPRQRRPGAHRATPDGYSGWTTTINGDIALKNA